VLYQIDNDSESSAESSVSRDENEMRMTTQQYSNILLSYSSNLYPTNDTHIYNMRNDRA